MAAFPHEYRTRLTSSSQADELVLGAGPAPDLTVGAPAQFGGTDDHWSPETLLTGAVASCFALSFKAIAQARQYEWDSLQVEVDGVLDRVDRQMSFTSFVITARLLISDAQTADDGKALLEKAEQTCLVSASLKSIVTLQSTVLAA